MMTYEVLKKLYKGSVFLAGNIPGKSTLELLKEIATSLTPRNDKSSQDVVLLELSSWELQGWHDEKFLPTFLFLQIYTRIT